MRPKTVSPIAAWSEGSVPDLTGRVAVVTGANSGIGFETARVLAAHGADVVLACRSEDRARAAQERIIAAGRTSATASGTPLGSVETLLLDLASLASVERAADSLLERDGPIDLLINNAGVMSTPYSHTTDGFETQFGTNHLGHFAFTGRLLPKLLTTPGSRVVNVSSLVHRKGSIDFADLAYENGYKPNAAYCRSKLANLLFTFELQRRLDAASAPTAALAAHPGFVYTEILRHYPAVARMFVTLVEPFLGQNAAMGALPTLRAAVDPEAVGGQFYGPDGRMELIGYPRLAESSAAAHDVEAQRRLWAVSGELTGVTYPV